MKTLNDYPTPLTDEARIDNADLSDQGYGKSEYVPADFARQLEREVAMLREALEHAIARTYHGPTCTFEQRQKTGCVCGLIDAEKCARAALDATKP